MSAKKAFINEILRVNPGMRQVGTSDVWMDIPSISKNGRLLNMTVRLPAGAKLDGHDIVKDGIRIHVYQP